MAWSNQTFAMASYVRKMTTRKSFKSGESRSSGACTLKWCDGLRASVTPKIMSAGVLYSWQVQPSWTGLWGRGQMKVYILVLQVGGYACPRWNTTSMMGDFNAKIDSDSRGFEEIMGQRGLGEMNDWWKIRQPMCFEQPDYWRKCLPAQKDTQGNLGITWPVNRAPGRPCMHRLQV